MNRRRGMLAALAWSGAFGQRVARAQASTPRMPELKALGDERYQVGRIVVDKPARSFTVPGRVHALEPSRPAFAR